jgi:hypothetical protein
MENLIDRIYEAIICITVLFLLYYFKKYKNGLEKNLDRGFERVGGNLKRTLTLELEKIIVNHMA